MYTIFSFIKLIFRTELIISHKYPSFLRISSHICDDDTNTELRSDN